MRRSGSLEHGEERAGRGWRHPAGALAGGEAFPSAPARPVPGGIRAAGLSPLLQAGRGGAKPRGAARTLGLALALGSGKGERHPSFPYSSFFFPSPSPLPNTRIPKSRGPLRLRPLRAALSLKEELGRPFRTKTELLGCGDRGGEGWAGAGRSAPLRGASPPGPAEGTAAPGPAPRTLPAAGGAGALNWQSRAAPGSSTGAGKVGARNAQPSARRPRAPRFPQRGSWEGPGSGRKGKVCGAARAVRCSLCPSAVRASPATSRNWTTPQAGHRGDSPPLLRRPGPSQRSPLSPAAPSTPLQGEKEKERGKKKKIPSTNHCC